MNATLHVVEATQERELQEWKEAVCLRKAAAARREQIMVTQEESIVSKEHELATHEDALRDTLGRSPELRAVN